MGSTSQPETGLLNETVEKKQERKNTAGRRSTGPANRFSQLLNEELRAAQSRRRLTLRALEELSGVSRNRLSLTLNLDSSPLNTNEGERW